MVVRKFGMVYEILTVLKVSKLFQFDLLKPCHVTDLPPSIKRARKKHIDISSQDVTCLDPVYRAG